MLRVMAGLNEEIKVLRERLAAAAAENEQLRGVRDELLAAQEEPRAAPAPASADDAAAYRARIADLQVRACSRGCETEQLEFEVFHEQEKSSLRSC